MNIRKNQKEKKYVILGPKNKVFGRIHSPDAETLTRYYEKIKQRYEGNLKNEFFEILDKDGKKTGELKLRDLIHKEGDLHGAFHLHIYTISRKGTYLLLQKRKHDKDICPNKLDTVVGGHYAVGEGIKDGVREVEEEIGLVVPFNKFTILGRRKNYDPQPEKDIFNNEFQDITLYKCNQRLEDYKLQESELAGILKVNLESFIKLMMRKINIVEGIESLFFNNFGNLEKVKTSIKREDVWSAPYDNYYLKTALLIHQIIKGKKMPSNPYQLDVTSFF
ncbi:NUDIX domain-containing protein [Candidatus Micrarchaeota archaeon]|nr:NUDIX domain-containing protein [Candidatus Micrarchaeota archaeon]